MSDSVICLMNVQVFELSEDDFQKCEEDENYIKFGLSIDDFIFVHSGKVIRYEEFPENYFETKDKIRCYYCNPCDDLLQEEISNTDLIYFLEGMEDDLSKLPYYPIANINRGEYLAFKLTYYKSWTDCGHEYDMDIDYLGLVDNLINEKD